MSEAWAPSWPVIPGRRWGRSQSTITHWDVILWMYATWWGTPITRFDRTGAPVVTPT